MASLVGQTLGKYELLEVIGRGGMATVYKGRQPDGDCVAVKVLSAIYIEDPNLSRRFQREIKVVMSLDHPNIVPVIDYGEEDGHPYLVMPYLEGGSLTDRLQRGCLSADEGSKVVSQIASALQLAHEKGIVHRDVKPSNIMLDSAGNALLVDFGLAHIHDASISLTGSALLGTPAYIAPEQAQGSRADARSDQYSLGVILFQLTTGSLPFEAETPMALVIKQINEPLPLPKDVNPNVPESIQKVILKATAKNPQHRFGSVGEMVVAFEAALAHAINPASNPAPEIVLPEQLTIPLASAPNRPRRILRLAALAAVMLIALLACPVASSSFLGMLEQLSNPAEGGELPGIGLDPAEGTALAKTIEAMSTELAVALSTEEIETAIIQTLEATPTLESEGVVETATWTMSALAGTETSTALPTGAPTATIAPTATKTATRTATKTATSFSSATPAPSSLPPPTATVTMAPSITASIVSSGTAAVSSTAGATLAPTGVVCSTASLTGFTIKDEEVHWMLNNAGSQTIQITTIFISWPASNDKLEKVRLGGKVIWDKGAPPPSANITSGWKGNTSEREVSPGSSKQLRFDFDKDAALSGYSLSVTLNGTCQIFGGG
jgi:serine/threonine protein kinase